MKALSLLPLVLAPAVCFSVPPEPGSQSEHPARGESCIVPEPLFLDRAAMDDLVPIPAPIYRLDTDGRELEQLETIFRDRGTSNNRINLVFVGDGYLSSQLTKYSADVTNGVGRLFSYPPFSTYRNFFAIYRVDVVSTVSGVTNDPNVGINRATPLQMNFWCGGTERLLCVNTTLARQYANNAPFPPDQVLAVANSSKYGGAGYPSADVGTYSGSNFYSPEVAIHELGHSFSDLADEYEYGGPTVHAASEPTAANVSIYTRAQLLAQSRKWFRWIGTDNSTFDGLQDSFEGGDYSYSGIYRPSNDSMMRNLARPFNLPSAEAIIASIYKVVKPIDTLSPAAFTAVTRTTTISLGLLQPIGQPLKVEWFVNSALVPEQTGASFNLAAFNFRKGASMIRCRVTDDSPWVKNPTTRVAMIQEKTWYISVAPCLADLTGDRAVDDADFALFIPAYNAFFSTAGDMNNDGQTDDADFTIFARQYDAFNCP